MKRLQKISDWTKGLAFGLFFVPFMAFIVVLSPFRFIRFRRFREKALAIGPGLSREEVRRELERAGARPAGDVGNVSQWSRHKGPFFQVGFVVVRFDGQGRVQTADYRECSQAA